MAMLSSGGTTNASIIQNYIRELTQDRLGEELDFGLPMSHMTNQEKVYRDIELLQSVADLQTAEIFRKRFEHRRQHRIQREDKPSSKSTLQLKASVGLEFVEVANEAEIKATTESGKDNEIKALEKKLNLSGNMESNAAIQAAISFLQNKRMPENESADTVSLASKSPEIFGIYTFFYNDDRCDYEASQSLEEGQKLYRDRVNDTAKLFIANGQVQRQKGDQLDIEICTGKALMQGKLKMKTYDADRLYVVNHEAGTIYNDIVKFNADRMEDALKNYDSYGPKDSTLLLRGSDGLILKKKGDDEYIAQSLAYLYNDNESQGHLQQNAYSQVFATSEV